MDIMCSQKVWMPTKKNIKYIIQKKQNISENSIDIIYKTDDVFMDFDWIAWHGMFF